MLGARAWQRRVSLSHRSASPNASRKSTMECNVVGTSVRRSASSAACTDLSHDKKPTCYLKKKNTHTCVYSLFAVHFISKCSLQCFF